MEAVARRIEALQTATADKVDQKLVKAAEKGALTRAKVLEELARIGFSNMMDYITINPQGEAFVDFSQLTREQAAAIGSIDVEEYTEGRGEDARQVKRTKFRLLDKKGALVDLGKHLGLFIDRKEIGGPGAFAEVSDDDLRQRLLARVERLGLPKPEPRDVIEVESEPVPVETSTESEA